MDVKISSKQKYNKYNLNDKTVYMTEYVYRNYAAQKTVNIILLERDITFSEFKNSYNSTYSEYLGGEIESGEEDTFKIEQRNEDTFKIEQNLSLSSSIVIDRMGEICIVKPVEQWYIDYADTEWKLMAKNCVENMNLNDYIKESLLKGIDWIKEWGVSRTFGLGTKIPFDERFIIDSLSDSTIYMAYYTISHLIHKDLYGMDSEFNPCDFTNEVWNFIFHGNWDDSILINRDVLEKMRESFEYFYPVDIRVSGKDLLTNHLVMFIFNHCAIFESKTPVSINCNGWILVNGEKMAKQKGNFITIESSLEENSVDAIRLTLADSGDGIDDANFETKKASDTNTLKLFTFV
jgi:leucyl-tRNA synthetase